MLASQEVEIRKCPLVTVCVLRIYLLTEDPVPRAVQAIAFRSIEPLKRTQD